MSGFPMLSFFTLPGEDNLNDMSQWGGGGGNRNRGSAQLQFPAQPTFRGTDFGTPAVAPAVAPTAMPNPVAEALGPAATAVNKRKVITQSTNGGLGGPELGGGQKMPWETMEGFNKMMDAKDFQNNLGLANTIIGGAQSLGSLGLGVWQMFQAQEMNKIAKDFAYGNFENTANLTNQAMEDKLLMTRGDNAQTRAEIERRKVRTTPRST